MLFSATLPEDIRKLSDQNMKNPVFIEIKGTGITTKTIDHELYNVTEKDKMQLLKDVTVVENPNSCIIFCNTKQKVDEVDRKSTV